MGNAALLVPPLRRVGNNGITQRVASFEDLKQIAAPAFSAAGEARIYLDSTSKKVRISEDGGAYADIVGGADSLNAAYNLGVGRIITANNGAVEIIGSGGLVVHNNGAAGSGIITAGISNGIEIGANVASYTFRGETDGWFHNGSTLRCRHGGTVTTISSTVWDFTTSVLVACGRINMRGTRIRCSPGSIVAPSIVFDDLFETSGFAQPAADQVACVVRGNQAWRAEFDGSDVRLSLYPGVTAVVRGAALTAENAAVIDAAYDAVEQGVLNNVRTRLGELESRMQGLGAIN